MAWPLPAWLRPLIRWGARLLELGWSQAQIEDIMEAPPHYWTPAAVETAIPEARRAEYFAQFIHARPGLTSFGSAWFAAARGAWYAAYGTAPTPEQRDWAFTRPQGMLGISVGVTATGARTGRQGYETITLNVPWSSSWQDVLDAVRQLVQTQGINVFHVGYEEVDPATIQIEITGGALLERQEPTITLR